MRLNPELTNLAVIVVVGVTSVVSCTTQKVQPRNAAPDSQPTFVLLGASVGAWTRKGGTESEFKSDSRFCLDNSADARGTAAPDEKASAAYATFLGCMQARAWSTTSVGAETKYVRPHETRD